jgi:hypothetical protein
VEVLCIPLQGGLAEQVQVKNTFVFRFILASG